MSLAACSAIACATWVRMAERVYGDAGGEIEVALAVGRDEPSAFAPLEAEVDACECRQEMRRHDVDRFCCFAHAPAKALPRNPLPGGAGSPAEPTPVSTWWRK